MSMPTGYQFIWHRNWPRWEFVRLDPAKTDMAYIYEWLLDLGFVEVRKWSRRKP